MNREGSQGITQSASPSIGMQEEERERGEGVFAQLQHGNRNYKRPTKQSLSFSNRHSFRRK